MPLETFTYEPSYSSELEWRPALNIAEFGDGYIQSMPDGINHIKLRFALTFLRRASAEAAAITAFIRATGATTPFNWLPPAPYNGATLIFKCMSYRHHWDEANHETIILEFEQSFNST